MPKARPLECPACGHDRILQRPHHLSTEIDRLQVSVTRWSCALCLYQWAVPVAAGRDEWETV